MPILTNHPVSPNDSRLIIEEIGLKTIAKECSITPGCVNLWKTRGIPKYRADYLKLRFPKLKVWKSISF